MAGRRLIDKQRETSPVTRAHPLHLHPSDAPVNQPSRDCRLEPFPFSPSARPVWPSRDTPSRPRRGPPSPSAYRFHYYKAAGLFRARDRRDRPCQYALYYSGSEIKTSPFPLPPGFPPLPFCAAPRPSQIPPTPAPCRALPAPASLHPSSSQRPHEKWRWYSLLPKNEDIECFYQGILQTMEECGGAGRVFALHASAPCVLLSRSLSFVRRILVSNVFGLRAEPCDAGLNVIQWGPGPAPGIVAQLCRRRATSAGRGLAVHPRHALHNLEYYNSKWQVRGPRPPSSACRAG